MAKVALFGTHLLNLGMGEWVYVCERYLQDYSIYILLDEPQRSINVIILYKKTSHKSHIPIMTLSQV